MRLKLGRPDLDRYSDRFDVPVAQSDAAISVTWLGVATLLIDDGSSALMTDGYFSRPGLARVAAGKVAPSPPRVDGCLARAKVSRLVAVIPVHTHIDHVMDSALVADRAYHPDGRLVPRREPGAVLDDPAAIAERVARMVSGGRVTATDGSQIEVSVESVCVHGDSPGAVRIAAAVRDRLEAAGTDIRAFC